MATTLKARRLVNPGRGIRRKRKLSPKQIAIFGTKRQKAALKAARSRKWHRVRSNPSVRKAKKAAKKSFIRHYGTGTKRVTRSLKRQLRTSYGRTIVKGLMPRKNSSRSKINSFNRKSTRAVRKGDSAKAKYYQGSHVKRSWKKQKLSNVGEIITLSLPGLNPGRRKTKRSHTTMARARRRVRRVSVTSRRRRRVRRSVNPGHRRRSYRRRRTAVARVTHRRRRRATNGGRVYHRKRRANGRRARRRNPGFSFLSGSSGIGKVLGILGGAALTKFVVSKLPASLTTGIPGYITTAVVATLGGKLVGKVLKKPALGTDLVLGGFVLLGLKLLSDFVPGFATYVPFGLNGLGLIGGSSFYVPQVPLGGSIASGQWTTPAGIPTAPPPSLRGLGERMNARRGGRSF